MEHSSPGHPQPGFEVHLSDADNPVVRESSDCVQTPHTDTVGVSHSVEEPIGVMEKVSCYVKSSPCNVQGSSGDVERMSTAVNQGYCGSQCIINASSNAPTNRIGNAAAYIGDSPTAAVPAWTFAYTPAPHPPAAVPAPRTANANCISCMDGRESRNCVLCVYCKRYKEK